jgi:hypothetical protein
MRMFLLLFLLEMLQKYKLLPRVIILTLLLKLAKPLSRLSSCCISPLQFHICCHLHYTSTRTYHFPLVIRPPTKMTEKIAAKSRNVSQIGLSTHNHDHEIKPITFSTTKIKVKATTGSVPERLDFFSIHLSPRSSPTFQAPQIPAIDKTPRFWVYYPLPVGFAGHPHTVPAPL